GEPDQAYRKAFEIDFIDAPIARDMTAALVAGLAEVLSPEHANKSPVARWKIFWSTMEKTDPFGFAEVPFAGRQLNKWMNKSRELVDRAGGVPKRLYELLEDEGKPVFWWDAHFTLLVALSTIEFCEQQPMAAMHFALDFGHDTDSYAQIVGCIIGAIYGAEIFPKRMRESVSRSLRRDYGEDIPAWIELLLSSNWSRV
ncbi:MAG: ADP-ribosylglycohydrolase family protein, partial [Planctomycetota bacterium]